MQSVGKAPRRLVHYVFGSGPKNLLPKEKLFDGVTPVPHCVYSLASVWHESAVYYVPMDTDLMLAWTFILNSKTLRMTLVCVPEDDSVPVDDTVSVWKKRRCDGKTFVIDAVRDGVVAQLYAIDDNECNTIVVYGSEMLTACDLKYLVTRRSKIVLRGSIQRALRGVECVIQKQLRGGVFVDLATTCGISVTCAKRRGDYTVDLDAARYISITWEPPATADEHALARAECERELVFEAGTARIADVVGSRLPLHSCWHTRRHWSDILRYSHSIHRLFPKEFRWLHLVKNPMTRREFCRVGLD